MANKFGKFLLATAALTTAAACAYYYLQKKEAVLVTSDENDDDYDNFNDSDDNSAAPNYVPLTPQSAPAAEATESPVEAGESLFSETDSSISAASETQTEENVEEFFNDNNN